MQGICLTCNKNDTCEDAKRNLNMLECTKKNETMLSKIYCGIDPGNTDSAIAVMNDKYELLQFCKLENKEMLQHIGSLLLAESVETAAIEMLASYGMSVGKSVFETCVWVGRFTQHINFYGVKVDYIYRMDEKMNLCHNSRAKDANIRQALIDRFATFDFKNGRGTKDNRDFFYGVSKDVWAAIAVCVTYMDKVKERA